MSWNERWELAQNVSTDGTAKGGQGEVRAVVRRADGAKGALKCMHSDHLKIRERRARVFQEVTALRALDGQGCPRVLETNAESWEAEGVELYLVMEWVEGPTLSRYVDSGQVPFDDAISVTRALLLTVGRCHQLGIFHRDLKPDNVIVPNASEPVLVDFGMSWSKPEESVDDTRAFETAVGQEIGNRFLRLPEHAAGRHEYHSASDVTMVVGLLFYMLARQAPRILSDASGAMPHERFSSSFAPAVTDDPRWPRLRRIFNVGFQSSIASRFSTVEDVLERLDSLLPPPIGDVAAGAEEELARIREITGSDKGRAVAAASQTMLDASQRYLDVHHKALQGTGFVSGGSGPNLTDRNQAVELQFFLVLQNSSDILARFRHVVRFESGYLTATVQVESEQSEVYYRGPAADPDSIIEAIEAMALRVIVKLFRYSRERLELQGG